MLNNFFVFAHCSYAEQGQVIEAEWHRNPAFPRQHPTKSKSDRACTKMAPSPQLHALLYHFFQNKIRTFNPIANGEGGGGGAFLVCTIRLAARNLEPFHLESPKFLASFSCPLAGGVSPISNNALTDHMYDFPAILSSHSCVVRKF